MFNIRLNVFSLLILRHSTLDLLYFKLNPSISILDAFVISFIILKSPLISSFLPGLIVPIPILPSDLIIALVLLLILNIISWVLGALINVLFEELLPINENSEEIFLIIFTLFDASFVNLILPNIVWLDPTLKFPFIVTESLLSPFVEFMVNVSTSEVLFFLKTVLSDVIVKAVSFSVDVKELFINVLPSADWYNAYFVSFDILLCPNIASSETPPILVFPKIDIEFSFSLANKLLTVKLPIVLLSPLVFHTDVVASSDLTTIWLLLLIPIILIFIKSSLLRYKSP